MQWCVVARRAVMMVWHASPTLPHWDELPYQLTHVHLTSVKSKSFPAARRWMVIAADLPRCNFLLCPLGIGLPTYIWDNADWKRWFLNRNGYLTAAATENDQDHILEIFSMINTGEQTGVSPDQWGWICRLATFPSGASATSSMHQHPSAGRGFQCFGCVCFDRQ